jgi:UDP-N-acetylmuramoyl-L-alanyl-D-glutamate--2,6-diaminopimelate ligase
MRLSEYLKNISEKIISISNFRDIEVESITNDSRKVSGNTLFVAIKGARLDGHDYIENAILSGACIVVYQNRPDVLLENIIYIEVDDAYFVYALLAEVYFQFPAKNMKIIGITGTNGKTTCAFLINHILNYAGFKAGLISTVQYSYGSKVLSAMRTTPEAFELQDLFSEMSGSGCKYVVMEVSSHSLTQHRLGRTKLAAALFTNISGDHLDYHGNMENYYLAKKRLFEMHSYDSEPETLKVINIDDLYGAMLKTDLSGKRVVAYGSDVKSDFKFLCDSTGTIAGLLVENRKHMIETSLIGRFNAYNITGSAALCLELGVPVDTVIEALKCFSSVPGRLEEINILKSTPFSRLHVESPVQNLLPKAVNKNRLAYTSNNVRCFVDYAHTDDALKRVLIALKGLNPSRLIVVFGCGGDRDKTKRPRMGKVASEHADIIVITDDNPRTENSTDIINDIVSGIPRKQFKVIPDRREAISYAVTIAGADDIILIAGKGHENYQEIGTKRCQFDDRDIVKNL